MIVLFLLAIPLVVFFHEAGHYAFGRRDGARFCVVKCLGLPALGVRVCSANMSVFDYLAFCFAGFAFSLPLVFLASFVSLKLMLWLFFIALGMASVDFYYFFRVLYEVCVGKAFLQDRIDSVIGFNLKVFE